MGSILLLCVLSRVNFSFLNLMLFFHFLFELCIFVKTKGIALSIVLLVVVDVLNSSAVVLSIDKLVHVLLFQPHIIK